MTIVEVIEVKTGPASTQWASKQNPQHQPPKAIFLKTNKQTNSFSNDLHTQTLG